MKKKTLLLLLFFNSAFLFSFSQTDSAKKNYIAPQFRGGDKGFSYYMSSYTNYPWSECSSGNEGDVFATIRIDKSGNVTDVITIGKNKNLNAEVKRILILSPKWRAGVLNGAAVDTSVTQKVLFSIQKSRFKKQNDSTAFELLSYTEPFDFNDKTPESEKSKQVRKDQAEAIAFYDKGTAELQNKNPVSALSLFNQALDLGLKSIDLYYNRGVAYFQIGNKDAACKDWIEAARMGDNQALDIYTKKCK